MTRSTTRRKRRFQFSLAILLLGVTLLSFALCWLAVRMKRARRQKEAIAAIEMAGGMVTYEYQYHKQAQPGPPWLRKVLGRDFFADVAVVSLSWNTHSLGYSRQYPTRTDALMRHVEVLTETKSFQAIYSDLTDEGMKSIESLRKLESLGLGATSITDRALTHLKGLTHLRELGLEQTSVSDAGLVHLHGLKNLEHLSLQDTQVTAAGVKELQEALPGCSISY